MKHILYIPGLSSVDSNTKQKRLMIFWPKHDTKVHIFDPKWNTHETCDQKYSRLLQFAKKMQLDENDKSTIVSISAGGSLAVRYGYENPAVEQIYFLSAKLKGSDTIGPKFQQRAPALVECVKKSEALLKHPEIIAPKVTTIRPLYDDVVPLKDMLIDGGERVRMPAVGHSVGIGMALLLYLPFYIRKQTTKKR